MISNSERLFGASLAELNWEGAVGELARMASHVDRLSVEPSAGNPAREALEMVQRM